MISLLFSLSLKVDPKDYTPDFHLLVLTIEFSPREAISLLLADLSSDFFTVSLSLKVDARPG